MTVSGSRSFWAGRKVLVTGHTGFKGSWLSIYLAQLGARLTGFALPASGEQNLFTSADVERGMRSVIGDVRDESHITSVVQEEQPEIVLHLAAQAIVRAGYAAPLETFATNVQGTANVLDAVRRADSVRVVVVVTTDKVYRNFEHPYPYRETDVLGGYDPYSASKAAAELIVESYRDSYLAKAGVAVATARAGNVIGGGDWTADRLIPDMVRAWSRGDTVSVRRPDAVRPWQHVLEALHGYLTLAERLYDAPNMAGAYNFGPAPGEAATVRRVLGLARTVFGGGDVAFEDGKAGPHEAGLLTLEIAKSRALLGVHPRWSLEQAIERTMDWYRRYLNGEDAYSLCQADIRRYESDLTAGAGAGDDVVLPNRTDAELR